MNSKYTNKNGGKKLLAAIMALAMVLVVGSIVIGGSVDTDAAGEKVVIDSDTTITGTPSVNGYIVTKDSIITIKDTSAEAIVHVLAGVKATFAFETTSTNGNVTVKAIKSNGDNVDNSTITLTTPASGSIVYTASEIGKESTLSGNVPGNVSFDLTPGLKIASAKFISGGIVTNEPIFGAKISSYSQTTYTAPGFSVGQIVLTYDSEHSTPDAVKICDASALITQGSNSLNMINVKSSSGIVATADSSTNPFVLSGTIDGGAVSVTSGIVKLSAGTEVENASGSLVVLTVSGPAYYLQSQIVTSYASPSLTFTGATVYGNVVQGSDVGTVSEASTLTISVGADSTLIVPAGVLINAGQLNVDSEGILRIFGDFKGTTGTISGKVLLGPTGIIKTVTATGNTNVESGKDTGIGGIPAVSEIGDAVLSDDLVIPAGTTFTVNGNLGLNGHDIIVNGNLIVSENGSIYTKSGTEKIILGSTGTIQNNGLIGRDMGIVVSNGDSLAEKKFSMKNLKGVEISYQTIGSDKILAVSGDLTVVRGNVASEISLSGVAIYGDFVIPEKSTLTIATASDVLAGASVVIGGKLTTTDALTLDEGSSIIINGSWDSTSTESIDVRTSSAGTPGKLTVDITTKDVKGLEIYSEKIAVVGAGGEITYDVIAYINGDVKKLVAADTPQITVAGASFTVAEGKALNIEKGITLVISNGVTVEGTLTYVGNISAWNYVGGLYTITTGESPNEVITNYIKSLGDALATASSTDVDDDTVTLKDTFISKSVTVPADVTLVLSGVTINDDAIVTVSDDATVSGAVSHVKGVLIVKSTATCASVSDYDTLTTLTDGTKVYANLQYAIDNANPDGVVKVLKLIDGTDDITIRSGITVDATLGIELTDSAKIIVEEDAVLKATSVSLTGTATDKAQLNVAGQVDLFGGSLAGTNYEINILNDDAKVILVAPDENLNGAYYVDDSFRTILTTVESAIASGKDVTVTGTVDYTDKILSVKDVKLTINSQNVKLGIVELDNAQIVADKATTFTAVALGADGVPAKVSVVKGNVNVTAASNEVARAVEYSVTIDAVDGTVTVLEGTVEIDSIIAAAAKSKLVIAEGAELLISGQLSYTETAANIATLESKGLITIGSKLTLTSANATVGDVQVEGVFEIATVKIVGDVTCGEDGRITVTGSKVIIGSLNGAGASVSGDVTVSADDITFRAYSDANIDEMKVVADAGCSNSLVIANYYVNGVLFATLYSTDDALTNQNAITSAELSTIPGVVVSDVVWKDSNNQNVTTSAITDGDVYCILSAQKAEVIISVVDHVSVWIDGVRYTTGSSAFLKVGVHTVEIVYDVGYTGDVKIWFDGTQLTDGTVKTSEFTVTSEQAVSVDDIVLSAFGTVKQGEEPVGPVEPAEPSEDYIVSVSYNNGKLIVSVIALDGGYIPATEVAVNFSAVKMTTILGETVPAPTTLPESFDITDDNRSDVVNKTFELADVIGENISIMGVSTAIGQTNFGYMSLGYKP